MRPVPDDFDALFPTMTHTALEKHYRASFATIEKWLAGRKAKSRIGMGTRPMPDDFPTVAQTMTVNAMSKHYGTSHIVVERWLNSIGLTWERSIIHHRPAPDDFVKVAPTMSKEALKAHYRTSSAVLDRWIKETGAKAKPFIQNPKRVAYKLNYGNLAQTRTSTMFDEAADVIRRERFVVHRCDEQGHYAEGGDFWRVGWSVLTPDDLLARADKYRRRAA